jgi:hypothetical protein
MIKRKQIKQMLYNVDLLYVTSLKTPKRDVISTIYVNSAFHLKFILDYEIVEKMWVFYDQT